MYQCEYCGSTLPKYQEVCPGCGSKIDIIKNKIPEKVTQVTPQPKKTAPPLNYQNQVKRSGRKAIFFGCIVILLFYGALYLIGINGQADERGVISSKLDENKSIYEYKEELSQDPTNVKAYRGLINKYLESGAIDAALIEVNHVIEVKHDEAALFKQIADDLIKYDYKHHAMSVLQIGYAYTKDESLKEMRQTITPKEVLESGAFKQALELIYQKPIAEVKWEDIDKIKYIELNENTLRYSFSDREEYKDSEQFEDTVAEVTVEEELSKAGDIALFDELTELHTSLYNTLYINDIAGLSKLKKLYVGRIYGSEDLKPFAVFNNLQTLWVGGDDFKSLEGITELKSLKEIGLKDTALTNLSVLSGLKNITAVHLSNNEGLKSLATLGSMKHLKQLSIEGDVIKDLSFLKDLSGLEALSIKDTLIKSAAFLKTMPNLKYLRFEDNDEVKDIKTIAANGKLEELYLDCSDLSGITAIRNLTNMKKLTLTGADDLSVISKFTYLKQLTLTSCSGTQNLKSLAYLVNLEKLDLSNNNYNISSLKPLVNLKKLKSLDLNKNDLYGNVSPLFTLSGLEYLNLAECHVNNGLKGIQNMSGLKELNLNSTKLIANTSIASEGFITSIDYDDIAMDQHTKYIAGLSKLEVLRINKTEIKNIGFLKNLKALKVLDLSDNYITDIGTLNRLSNIQYIDIRNNAVTDFSPLEKYTNAVVLGK